MATDSATRLETLRASLADGLLTPADDGWDAARSPWNLSVDQRPAAIATPRDADEIRAILRAAQDAGLGVTVQPHGHGASSGLDDCILIRPVHFDELWIDAAARTARAGAGADWGRVLGALDGTGLVALAGSNPEVSVVGYSLSGGHSAFSRAFGLASNAITAIELVTAEGADLRVDAESDPELFWGLRGGGGLFGVVTAIEFRLFALPEASGLLYGGKLTYPGPAARSALRAMVRVAAGLPDEVSVSGGMLHLPDAPMIPEPLRGKTIASIDVVSLRDAASTEALIAPLRSAAPALADTIAPFPLGALPQVAAEPTDPVAAIDRGLVLAELDERTIDDLVDGFEGGVPLGLSLLQVRPLGGAVARGSAGDGVAGRVAAAALVGASVIGPPGLDHGAADEALAHVLAAASGAEAAGVVATFLSAGDDLSRSYDTEAIDRLRALKRRVDPDGLIRSNRPLPGIEE